MSSEARFRSTRTCRAPDRRDQENDGGRAVRSLIVGVVALTALLFVMAAPLAAQTRPPDLKRMSLEELMRVDVTTVSRAPLDATQVPAAIHVITSDDIRRSGATSIPEALRLAPGVQVARINGGTWAIGIRGFADRLARSMLVLIDGRAVYSPLFAGTYWEVQDTLLQDIDRIEVIRGPGGTLWGANAVNGIINIVTKTAAATRGLMATGGAGTHERAFAGLRYGGAVGDAWMYRLYAKAFDRTSHHHPDDLNFDGMRSTQAGFRADWSPSRARRSVTVQGDAYRARLGQRPVVTTFTPPYSTAVSDEAPLAGGNLLARVAGPLGGANARFQLQTFYARTSRTERPVSELRDTFDVDFQQTSQWTRHQTAWGVGYRVTTGRITAVAPSAFTPPTRTDHLYSAFVQDEITVVPRRVRVTVGSKIEHNAYTGVEVQPSARLLWMPGIDQSVIVSVARAVRTPSRVETDYTTHSLVNASEPVFVRLLPNPDFTSERLVAYEVGYRVRPIRPLYLTFAGFYNRLDDVLSTEVFPAIQEPIDDPVRTIIPLTFGNGVEGASYGLEASADFRPVEWWRWTGNYSHLRVDMRRKPGSLDGSQERRYEGISPQHQVLLQSSIDLPRGGSLDTLLRYTSALDVGPVDSHLTGTVRVGWLITPHVELSIVGQDLAGARHVEWPGTPIQIERSGLVTLTIRR